MTYRPRATSVYTLVVEIPGADGPALGKMLDAAIREAVGLTGSWLRRYDPSYGIHVPFVAVSFRCGSESQAAIYADRIVKALGPYDADLTTGYGAHRRTVATTRPEPEPTSKEA